MVNGRVKQRMYKIELRRWWDAGNILHLIIHLALKGRSIAFGDLEPGKQVFIARRYNTIAVNLSHWVKKYKRDERDGGF